MIVFPVSSSVRRRALRTATFPHALRAALDADTRAYTDGTRVPPLDVVETDDAYTATLDMPGITKEQLSVTVEDRRVEISTAEAAQTDAATEHGAAVGARPLHRERREPHYARSFVLPTEVDAEAAQARMESGVLTLTLPKRITKRAATVTVQ